MKRRAFIKTLAASGIALNMPFVTASAHASSSGGKYLVVVNAKGGWDPTSLCDPKGMNEAYGELSSVLSGSTNSVAINSSKRFGEIVWSDVPDNGDLTADDLIRVDAQFENFFSTHGNRLTVVNGIDTGTNNHEVGARHVWSGKSDAGHPSLAAFYAAAVAPTLPMSFISHGGYDVTASVVARTRPSNASFISEIATPNKTYSNRDILMDSGGEDIYGLVQQAQNARLERQLSSDPLYRRRRQLSQLFGVRSDDSDLSGLIVHLEDVQNNVSMSDNLYEGRAEYLKEQAQLVAAAFKANLAVSANLNLTGFDTHDNHDARAYPAMGDILEGVHYLMLALDYLGIREQTTVVIGSDFGRTPYYNVNNGKDHWPVTSMMVLQGNGTVTGGRVFGASTPDFHSQAVNGISGTPDAGGLILNPGHVNQELRRILGVSGHALAEVFPLPDSNFNIFV